MADAARTGDADRLTIRDPGLDLDALERGHTLALVHYHAAYTAEVMDVAAAWEALLVASDYGWPARPRNGPMADTPSGPVRP